MDSLLINKIAAAILVSGIAFFLAGTIGDILVRSKPLHEAAIKIDVPTGPAGGAPAGPAPLPPLAPLLASGSAEAGQAIVQKVCSACHTFVEGGPNGIGPNLYGVLGSPHGHLAGFNFSAALKGKQGPWTYDELNEWLHKPSGYAPGTRMAYAGMNDAKQRADVILYLRSLSKAPEKLPEVTEAAPAPAPTPQAAATPAATAGGGLPPLAPLLAKADPAAGEAFTKKVCVVCHTFNQGGRAGVGPNLFGVVGGPHAHMAGFNYSPVMKAKQGPWTYDELNQWLYKPAQYAPGNRMVFVGIPNAQERANVIAFLKSISPEAPPLPQ